MSFEEKIPKMYELFLNTEKQLFELSQIIPLDNPNETYSIRLYSILHITCAQVEGMFKILCKKLGLKVKHKDFDGYFSALNSQGMLENQMVYINIIKEKIHPFLIRSKKSPEWWQGYNDTKHDLPEGVKRGNVENTIKAMSALCALHNISHFVRYRQDELLNKKQWREIPLLNTINPVMMQNVLQQTTSGQRNEIFFPLSSYVHPSSSIYQKPE